MDEPVKKKKAKKIEEEKEVLDKEEPIKEIIVEKRSGFNLLEMIIVMGITLLFGVLIGSAITYSRQSGKVETNFAQVPKQFQEFMVTYQNILDNYYEKLDENKLLDAGIKGMIEYLDDTHSVYMDEAESQAFNEKVEGNYVGIGAEVTLENGMAKISSMFDGSPAIKAGLQVGDIIKQVNGEEVTGKTLNSISGLIKGKKNSTVKIKVLRNEEEKEFVVIRDTVEIASVHKNIYEQNGKKIGYLQMDIFAANTAKQFESELKKLEDEQIDSLIIDVRGNPGGHLTQVSEILSLLLEKGKILYQIETKGIKEPTYDWTKDKRDYPIAVLINHSSASASEILAAALKEVYGAHIVGITSYGKGTVQKAYELNSGATIKYTTQKWLTPNGNYIDQIGVEPTETVELNEAYYTNPSVEMDNQLQKALEILSVES